MVLGIAGQVGIGDVGRDAETVFQMRLFDLKTGKFSPTGAVWAGASPLSDNQSSAVTVVVATTNPNNTTEAAHHNCQP
jgi:hypothetical protein